MKLSPPLKLSATIPTRPANVPPFRTMNGETLTFVNARLFDGKSAAHVIGATVVVEGATISTVGHRLPAPDGPTVVDLSGQPLIPCPRDAEDGVAECRKAARTAIRAGAEFLKIFTSGGVMSMKTSPDARTTPLKTSKRSAMKQEPRAAELPRTRSRRRGSRTRCSAG